MLDSIQSAMTAFLYTMHILRTDPCLLLCTWRPARSTRVTELQLQFRILSILCIVYRYTVYLLRMGHIHVIIEFQAVGLISSLHPIQGVVCRSKPLPYMGNKHILIPVPCEFPTLRNCVGFSKFVLLPKFVVGNGIRSSQLKLTFSSTICTWSRSLSQPLLWSESHVALTKDLVDWSRLSCVWILGESCGCVERPARFLSADMCPLQNLNRKAPSVTLKKVKQLLLRVHTGRGAIATLWTREARAASTELL